MFRKKFSWKSLEIANRRIIIIIDRYYFSQNILKKFFDQNNKNAHDMPLSTSSKYLD